MLDLSKVRSPISWPQCRGEIANEVREVLGTLPKEKVELQLKTVDEIDYPGYVRRRVNYFVDSWTRISAWLFLPEGKDEAPGILCCHQRVPQGKDEPAGKSGDPMLYHAQRYAEMGYVAIAPDCITAGDRVLARKEPYDTRTFYKDSSKMSLAGKMLWDHMQGISVLEELKRVDPARIGVIGHGMGGTNALFLAAFDNRIQACVSSCGFSRFEKDMNKARWHDDDTMQYMPKLEEAFKAGGPEFDWEHILALAAPSPTLLLNTLSNSEFDNPKSCDKAFKQAKKIYKALGAESALDYYAHHDGHALNSDLMDMADDWFDRWL